MTSYDNHEVGLVGHALYERVASRLRAKIQAGEFAPGERLPTEQALSAAYAVSRPTVRSALAQLCDEGLVLKRQGLGSFVRPQRLHQTLARLETLGESIADQGATPRVKVLSSVFGQPPDLVRTALGLPDGAKTLHVRRLHSIGDEPIALVELCVAEDIGSRLSRRDVERRAFYELLPSRLGIPIGRAVQTVRAEAGDIEVGRLLKVPNGSCLLVCERVTFSEDDRPVIYALFRYRADRFEFRISLSPHVRKVDWLPPGLMPQTGASA